MQTVSVACVTVSVVSHGHDHMVAKLVPTLLEMPQVAKVLVTQNLGHGMSLPAHDKVMLLVNEHPMGFGANHNQAFQHCDTPYFCVLNPDVECPHNPFPSLLNSMGGSKVRIAAPLVLNGAGEHEDSCRKFPSLWGLMLKALGRGDGRCELDELHRGAEPDWLAGMFMLFCREAYSLLEGFDEGFFLYYEDVDICLRARRKGMKLAVASNTHVVHHAQRASRRDWKHRVWHARSLLRYLCKDSWRLPVRLAT